ncbi:MAG: hypothetical protein IJR70_06400 [Eubacterium sp.]|nr:hypothetical protein [Eubacterium sp.]
MISEFDMSAVNIPYGVLHDSSLTSVKCENNKMIFSFDIEIFPQDYTDDFYKQYEKFKKCNMIVEMAEEPFNYFSLLTCINNRGKFKGLSLNREDFLYAVNSATKATFIECSSTYSEFKIELSVSYHNAKGKARKYKKYDMFNITLDAKKVIWEWF